MLEACGSEPLRCAGDQDAVVAFLGSPAAYGPSAGAIERRDTHGAMLFLVGDEVYKIKRAVKFPYMDFSTLEQRRRTIEREFEINRRQAPDLYLGVVPITQDADGTLRLDGHGRVVEWALRMRRFDQSGLLAAVVARGAFDTALAAATADAIAATHATAPADPRASGQALMQRVIAQIADGIAAEAGAFDTAEVAAFRDTSRDALERVGSILDQRSAAGSVRRCHGDLHLANIVIWQGRPTVFDALEFSEELATIDTLYDLAFLLMDLDAAGARPAANLILNRYVRRSDDKRVLEGLAALPLFLAARAGIRAMVGAERAAQQAGPESAAAVAGARRYLDAAVRYLDPPPPRLVAVGGFSGTGKSTLAAALAPGIGAAPGALHIRADLERKAMFGVADTDRLPQSAYAPEVSAQVYGIMLDKTASALRSGHSVILDGVFAQPAERAAAAATAAAARCGFHGLWLSAPQDVLVRRVTGRRGDASDATADVVALQVSRGAAGVDWSEIAAGGPAAATLAAATRALGTS